MPSFVQLQDEQQARPSYRIEELAEAIRLPAQRWWHVSYSTRLNQAQILRDRMVFRAQAEEIGRSLGYTPEDFHEAWAYQMRTLYEGPAIVPQNGANDNGYEQGGQVQSPWTASSRDVRVNPSQAFRPISAADAQSTIRTNRHRVERGNEPEGRGDPVPRGDGDPDTTVDTTGIKLQSILSLEKTGFTAVYCW